MRALQTAQPRGRIGTVIAGTWKLDRRLGTGGTSAVYEAHDRKRQRVAVKILRPDLARQEGVRARFLREASVANAIEHPGVVPVLAEGVTRDGCPFLVMELLKGETLEQKLAAAGGRLELRVAVSLAIALLEVLSAAHACGVVHRDVKPGNVFVGDDGRVRLLDFGLATSAALEIHGATRTSMGWGTPAFLAPEQTNGRYAVDARTDIWAVGALLHHALTGAVASEPAHPAALLAASCAPDLAALDLCAPSSLVAVVARSLEKDPARRFADADSMAAALTRVLDDVDEPELASGTFALMTLPRLVLDGPPPRLPARPATESIQGASVLAFATPFEVFGAVSRTLTMSTLAVRHAHVLDSRLGMIGLAIVGALVALTMAALGVALSHTL